MVALRISYLNNPSFDVVCFGLCFREWSRRYLKQDLCVVRKKSSAHQQCPARTNIESRAEFEEFLPPIVHAPNKHWDGNAQPLPAPPFAIWRVRQVHFLQANLRFTRILFAKSNM